MDDGGGTWVVLCDNPESLVDWPRRGRCVRGVRRRARVGKAAPDAVVSGKGGRVTNEALRAAYRAAEGAKMGGVVAHVMHVVRYHGAGLRETTGG